MTVKIPLIWQVEGSDQQTSVSIFLGKIEADKTVDSSVSFMGKGLFRITESKNSKAEILEQSTSENVTKLKLRILPSISKNGMQEGIISLKSTSEQSVYFVNWSAFSNASHPR